MPEVMATVGQNMSHHQNVRKHCKEVSTSWVQTAVRALQ